MIRLKIREIAEAKKISQRQLSLRSGVDDRTIHRLWIDPYRNVETITLDKIAKVLGVNANELLESVPDDPQEEETSD